MTVNFASNMNLDQMLEASRINGSKLKFLFEEYPISGAAVQEMPVMCAFGREIDVEKVVAELLYMKLRPATFAELLFYAANNSEEAGSLPIVALDRFQVYRYEGIRYVPLIDLHKRELSAEAWIDVGERILRFAAVPI